VVVTVLGLVVANGLAMFWFGRLAGHADVEQVTMGLFGLATVAHVALLTRHRW
jgi:hypothetical protein